MDEVPIAAKQSIPWRDWLNSRAGVEEEDVGGLVLKTQKGTRR
jgi:hypothetical protein